MSNNIVITGDKYVGKSTIVKNVVDKLNLKPGGFVVDRTGEVNGWLSFYLVDPLDYYYHWQGKDSSNYKKKCQIFAKRDSVKEDWTIYPEVFNNKGVYLLNTGKNFRDIVIMDELGRFELKSDQFQKEVLSILESTKPVIAVIKDEHNRFLDKVRKELDDKILRVKPDNREEIFNKIVSYFKNIYLQINNTKE